MNWQDTSLLCELTQYMWGYLYSTSIIYIMTWGSRSRIRYWDGRVEAKKNKTKTLPRSLGIVGAHVQVEAECNPATATSPHG